jgi:signal transduction histidine kinase
MQSFSIKEIILFSVLFFVHGIFFVQAALSTQKDRYRKIFVRFVAGYMSVILVIALFHIFFVSYSVAGFIVKILFLLLPVFIVGTNILVTRYYDFSHIIRDHQLGVTILIGLIALVLITEPMSLFLSIAIAVCSTTVAWEFYFHNEHMLEINIKNKEMIGTKNEFLSFTTHQLRSPLTQLKWGLGAVAEGVADRPTIAKMVTQLRTTSDEMISTVNDLLDISKIEQGGMVLKKELIDLVSFLDRAAEEFRVLAEIKGLQYTFEPHVTTAPIIADQTKLRQVINNLIDNAIKYTVSGSIKILLDKQFEKNTYTISIVDTGAGIAAEEIPKLFLKFSRGNAGKIFMGGSGLGLYLGKKITEMHQGTISVYSAGIGAGSTFVVKLPIDPKISLK